MGSPLDAVLTTPELLKNVLGFLQIHEIYRSQRVCAFWRDVFATSPKLQRQIYVGPEALPLVPIGFGPNTCPIYQGQVTIHPYALWWTCACPSSKSAAIAQKSWVGIELQEWLEFAARYSISDHRLAMLENGPWMEQFVTQPPCTVFQLRCVFPYNVRRRSKNVRALLFNKSGIRFMDVWSVLQTLQKNAAIQIGSSAGSMSFALLSFMDDSEVRSWPTCDYFGGEKTPDDEVEWKNDEEPDEEEDHVAVMCGTADCNCESCNELQDVSEFEDDWEAETSSAFVSASVEGSCAWVSEGYAMGIGDRRRQAAGLEELTVEECC